LFFIVPAFMALSRKILMGNPYTDLLDATIRHLEGLKARGVSFVPVEPETLAALSKPAAKAAAAPARPAPVSTPARPGGVPAAPRVSTPAPIPPPVASKAPVTQPPGAAGSKLEAFENLRDRVLKCQKCPHLVAARKHVVFGVGNQYADLMFVGEAPGADEDVQGEPFVGAAGQLLTKIIRAMGLKREDVYIANILKCRPDTPGQRFGNRKPTPQEMATCIPYLHEQIDLIQPKVLVALGATAVEGLLGASKGISKLRGNWQTYRGLPLMPTYHPAFLLRNQSSATKRQVWEDMLKVMERLGLPISEKQRNYFR